MRDSDFPALYRSAENLSQASQAEFYRGLRLHLVLLVIAAALSVVGMPHWSIAVLQLLVLLGALSCSVYLFSKRPDQVWYGARAVAESIKTVTWRFASRAEPFQGPDPEATRAFQRTLKEIVDQNREVAQALTMYLDEPQITEGMSKARQLQLEERKAAYAANRIKDQLEWYAKKAASNRRKGNGFFWALIGMNGIAVLCAILRVRFPAAAYWPTDIVVVGAASLLSWMQAKRFSELASAYALAAHEISLVREKAMQANSESDFSTFVGDAENAFSREHTQWVARRDA